MLSTLLHRLRQQLTIPDDLVEFDQWRDFVLSKIIAISVALGMATAIPSVLLALGAQQLQIAAVDISALVWLIWLWRWPGQRLRWRAASFLALAYLLGLFFLLTIGVASQAYLLAVPVMAALFMGLRPAFLALALNALTLFVVTCLPHAMAAIPWYENTLMLESLITTLNFTFVDALITISCAVLLHGLAQSLKRQQRILHSLAEEQRHLQWANKALHLIGTAVANLNDMIMILDPPTADSEAHIVFVNDAFVQGTGYTRAEVIGKNLDILSGPDTDQAEAARLQLSTRGQQATHGELFCYTKERQRRLLEIDMVPVTNDEGRVTNWVSIVRDITERKQAEQHIHQLAYYDVLTGLPNRRLLLDSMAAFLPERRLERQIGALLYIDLDHFKNINDTRGHTIGDLFLRQVAQRLNDMLAPGEMVARLGGDEFVILTGVLGTAPDICRQNAVALAERAREALLQPFALDGTPYTSGASIGVTLSSDALQTVDDLLREADIAMYHAKSNGRNRIALFEAAMQTEIEQKLALESDLAQAIERRELEMHVQPQVDFAGRTVGAELLIRWYHPLRGIIEPEVFIPLAEDNGMILGLGEWVLRHGCETVLRMRSAGYEMPLSINVSPRQFRQIDFVEQVGAMLLQTGAPASALIFEVTEGLLIESLDDTIVRMQQLAKLGIRFSIDDFGTGYSSMSYLKRLPLYELKIDKDFIRDTPASANDTAIVSLILSMAHHFGLRVVAEGVENQAQADFLAANGCDAMQGYLFARPMPIGQWLQQAPAAGGTPPATAGTLPPPPPSAPMLPAANRARRSIRR